MTKIALIGDTHFGCRSDSEAFDKSTRRFFEEQFFPYLKEHQITEVIHLGDLFDRRKYVNFQILKNSREYFLTPVGLCADMCIIPGNHDVYHKNTNGVNSLDLLLGGYEFNVVQSPVDIIRGGISIALVPWVTDDNRESCMKFLERTESTICIGHFDIVGFEMHKGSICEHGFDPSVFKKFDMVFSGHFHHKSSKGNIHYLGCPYEMSWSDFDDPKGFHVFDTKTRDVEFIANPNVMHHKIYYDDTKKQSFDYKIYTGAVVKLVVVQKTDYAKFDMVVENLYTHNVLDLKILEDLAYIDDMEDEDGEVNLEDTASILSNYIDDADIKLEKSRLKTLIKALFVEAQSVEILE